MTSDTDLDGVFEVTDFAKTTNQTLNVEGISNRLLGLSQTTLTTNNDTTSSSSAVTTPVTYTVDANGAMTSDGLRAFNYDASNRTSKVKVYKDGETASISYLLSANGLCGSRNSDRRVKNASTSITHTSICRDW